MQLKRFLRFFVFLAIQVLVFNHVQVYGYGVPMVCILPILLFPLETPRWQILLWSFAIGLLEDIFTNTPGMSAATLTLIGMVQPALLRSFTPRDEEDDDAGLVPSSHTLGWAAFVRYLIVATLLQALCFFTLEAFSFFNIWKYLINILSSWAMTAIILTAFESIRSGASRHTTT